MAGGKKLQKAAKELTYKRHELKAILIEHDVDKFRAFIEENNQAITDPDRILELGADEMSDYMYHIKASQPHFGQNFQEARNILRAKLFQVRMNEKPDALGLPLRERLAKDGDIPRCNACQYFRDAPSPGEFACIRTGKCMPEDVGCIGWTPIKN
jgi:hypothetical protein